MSEYQKTTWGVMGRHADTMMALQGYGKRQEEKRGKAVVNITYQKRGRTVKCSVADKTVVCCGADGAEKPMTWLEIRAMARLIKELEAEADGKEFVRRR